MSASHIIQTCLEAGVSVRLGDAGTLLATPAARITPAFRALIRDNKAALLLELGLPTPDPFDDRVTCTTCRHLWPGNHCLQHRRAGLTTRDLADDFTHLAQRCDAYAPLARGQAP